VAVNSASPFRPTVNVPESVTVTAVAPVKPRLSVKSVEATALVLVAFADKAVLKPLDKSLVESALVEVSSVLAVD
jgi:hypothetical protein